MNSGDNKKRIFFVVIGIIVVLGLLWYYQQQGLISVFPTTADRELQRLTEIDESKFLAADGLGEEDFQAKISELRAQRGVVLDNPQDAQAWFQFGNLLEFLNDHEGAIEAWKKTLEFQELNFVAAANIATNYQYFIKDFPAAEQYYLISLDVKPDNTPAYSGLMDLYQFNMKNPEKLEEIILMAVANDPLNAIPYYTRLVEFFAREDDFVKAKEYLPELRERSSDQADSLVNKYPELASS